MFEATQYAAVISLGLLVLALWRPWRRQSQRMTIAIAFVGLVLLLGLAIRRAVPPKFAAGPTPALRRAKPSITTSSFSEAGCASTER